MFHNSKFALHYKWITTNKFTRTTNIFQIVDCKWGHWGEWSECNAACGKDGVKMKQRNKTIEENETGKCNGTYAEEEKCVAEKCSSMYVVLIRMKN